MKCQRCGTNLSGYVELGSEGYQRVSAGRCPNCGASMPAGVKMGFAESKQALNPRVSRQNVLESYSSTSKYAYPSVYFSFLGGLGIFLWGYAWWSALLGILFWLFFAVIGWGHYGELNLIPFYSGNSYRESDMRTITLFLCVLIASVFLLLIGIGYSFGRDGAIGLYWLFGILAGFLISHAFIRILNAIFM